EGVGHQLGRVVGPGDDIDPLRPQLADDAADPDTTWTDAGTDRVDALLVGRDRDLGADSRFASQRPDDNGAGRQLRDLELEQPADQCLVGPGYHHLRPAASLA